MPSFQKIFLSLFVVACIVGIVAFGYSVHQYYLALHSDDPIDPYVQVYSGSATVVRGEIAIDLAATDRYIIQEGDAVLTKSDGEASVFWPDHSTTALGKNTKLVIKKMQVANDYSKIELALSLETGKIWSNMVRTMYPGSFINVRLPNHGIIAGVRGTVFSIDIDTGSIHSVDHALTVQNALHQKITLLPNEIVSLWDIFVYKSKEALDTVWENANIVRDTTYNTERAVKLKESWGKISGKAGENNWWDRFVRWVLSWFSYFRELNFAYALRTLQKQEILQMPQTYVLEWYQKLRNKDFVQERDFLRGVLQDISKNSASMQQYLQMDAIWDALSFPSMSLENTKAILSQSANNFQVNTEEFVQNFFQKDYGKQFFQQINPFNFEWQ